MMHAPRLVRVTSTRRESSRHATIGFRDMALAGYGPGQFVMTWLPGIDEVPMAIWGGPDEFRLTVEAKGEATRALAALRRNDWLGVRGPYGNPFRLQGKDIVLVGGGTGVAPLVKVANEAAEARIKLRLVLGARSQEFLLLQNEFERAGVAVHTATDDGSEGHHGRAHELLDSLVEERTPDAILTCGPEAMMRAVAEVAWRRSIPVQASLERWMKCAVGICDACLVDDVRLCRDGPVLDDGALRRSEDFGSFERGPDGRRSPIHASTGSIVHGRNV